MIDFLLLMAVPTLIAVAVLFIYKGKIVWWEFGLQILVPAVIITGILCLCSYSKIRDTEIWNSQVVSRNRQIVPCRHSYECNCVKTGKTTSCSTCYEHAFDVDWFVRTSSSERLNIPKVDSQGLIMPKRWREAYVGEPFSSKHVYQNYILANPNSVLFGGKGDTQRFAGLLPRYPGIYNLYRTDHFIVTGGLPIDARTWNWLLDEANKTLGPDKQANVLVVVAKTDDPSYALALKQAWAGGKKNDVVVIIGSLDGHKIEWVDVMSWTPREDLKVELRDQIQAIGSLDQRDAIVQVISSQVRAKFVRMHMKDYRYLLSSIEFSIAQLFACFILALFAEAGVTYWVIVNSTTLDEPRTMQYRRRYS